MKTLKFINGDIEFYKAPELVYEMRHLLRDSGSQLTFTGYNGRVGLHDCAIYIDDLPTNRTDISGSINGPAYISVNGSIDISVSPKMRLSVRSSDQGRINGELMKGRTPYYFHGPSLTDYVTEYFNKLFSKDDFELSIESDAFVGSRNYRKERIHRIDLCKMYDLVFIYSKGLNQAPIIELEYTKDDLADLDINSLYALKEKFLKSEKYEEVINVLNEINNRRKR